MVERITTYQKIAMLLIVFGFLFTVNAYAQLKLTATIEPSTCSYGDRVTYTATLSGKSSLPDINPPTFGSFDVISGPSSSTEIQMINGRVSRTKSISYVLKPRKTGRIIISPASAKDKRKVLKSNSVSLKVQKAAAPQTTSAKSNIKGVSKTKSGSLPDVFLVASADKDSVFLREMITVTYELYFKVNVSNYGFPSLPRATGFWQEEFKIPSRPPIRDATVRGVGYKVATIRKVGLFPTRKGKLTIEPLTAEVTVEVPRSSSRRRSVFDISRNRQEVKDITTQPLELVVKPLPAIGRPKNFQGDVGDFRVNVAYDNYEVSQHDAVNVTVKIDGTGYLKSIKPPKLKVPDGFETFDPTVTENITTSGQVMRGKKTFSYLIIPRRSGTFNLDAIEFSFFNTMKKKYKTVKSGAKRIVVNPAEDDAYIGGGGYSAEEVAILGSDIRFIKELQAPLTPIEHRAWESKWFIFVLLLTPGLFVIGLGVDVYVQRRRSDPALVRLRKAPEAMRRDLTQAAKLISQQQFKEAVSIASHGLAELTGATIREPAAGLTGVIIEKGLKGTGAEHELIAQVKHLLNQVDHIRFSGAEINQQSAEDMLDKFRETSELLEKLR
ncbi:MAG: protein BatD [Calditrichaeota bacterium]|nr:protein BatD [Calditrichota bacterium]MBT7619008.1 protein BatD [Calditrichota bacterium]MBT7789937.1 protein BatD [Calditrichota bacterium]